MASCTVGPEGGGVDALLCVVERRLGLFLFCFVLNVRDLVH